MYEKRDRNPTRFVADTKFDGVSEKEMIIMPVPLIIPHPIEQKLEELYALVEAFPLSVPVPRIATFLGVDDEGLRSSIDKGQCPFALGWQKSLKGNRGYKVPTVPFYLWYTQGVGFRV